MPEGEQPAVPNPRRRRRPRIRQVLLLKAYLDPRGARFNGVTAARMAGYKGSNRQLATQASRTLHNPNLQETFDTFLNENVGRALECLSEGMEATKVQAFWTDAGIVCTKPQPDHVIRLRSSEATLKLQLTRTAVGNRGPQSLVARKELVPRNEEEKKNTEAVAALSPEARNAMRDVATAVFHWFDHQMRQAEKKAIESQAVEAPQAPASPAPSEARATGDEKAKKRDGPAH